MRVCQVNAAIFKIFDVPSLHTQAQIPLFQFFFIYFKLYRCPAPVEASKARANIS
jgi:hypothetical protein